VFYETGTDDSGTVYGVADDSFLAKMIQLAGGTPVTTGSAESFAMPIERLIVEDPEVILLSDAAFGVTAEQVVARPGWDVITAVKSGEIRPIDDQTVTRPGPRLFLGLALLAKTIHPDATIPDPSPIPAVP
jgi:iron complex transport system substrate-binding protein